MKQILKKSLSIILAFTIIFSSAYVGLNEIDFSGIKFNGINFEGIKLDGFDFSGISQFLKAVTPDFSVESKAADNDSCGENLTWKLDDSGTLTINGTGAMTAFETTSNNPWYKLRLSISSVVINSGVTSIGKHAFYDCINLTSVIIPDSVTSIGDYAFGQCGNLTSVTMGDSVTSIGAHAFYCCTALESITIPDSVTSIGDNAFIHTGYSNDGNNWENDVLYLGNYLIKANSSLTGIYEIKSSTKCITGGAFKDCTNLVSITIPDSVRHIGDYAFYYCTSLASIKIPNSVTSIGDYAFSLCENLTSVTMGDGVTSIEDDVFSWCTSLASITIPDTVTKIGKEAFFNCKNLTSITIPDSVTSIGDYAFGQCGNLTSVTIGDSVTSIGDYAFDGCTSLAYVFYTGTEEQWGSITIGSDNTSLTYANLHYEVTDHTYGENVYDCSTATKTNECVICGHIKSAEFVVEDLLTFALSDDSTYYSITDCDTSVEGKIILHSEYNGLPVTNIGASAFKGCTSLTSITVPDSVTNISDYAFRNCTSLVSISIPDSVENIGDYAFENCSSLASISLPVNLTEISISVFNGCSSLVVITIPNKVTKISTGAFEGCTALTAVTIPNSVTSIGSSAFEGCTSLASITLPDTGLSIYEQAFNNTGYYNDENNWENDVLYIGNHLIKAKTSLTGAYEVKSGTKTIASNAFEGCTSLASVTISESVKRIGSSAFSGCTSLETATISDGVEYIGNSAFLGCTGLKSLTIPESVISIGSDAFKDCLNIEELYLGNNKAVSAFVFTEMENLTTVVLGNGVTSVYSYTFKDCTNLKFLTISESVSYISSNAFVDCVNIEELYLGNDVAVSAFVFNQLEKLTVVAFGNGVTNIPDSAFNGCVNLETVTISDSVKTVGNSAFYDCSGLSTITMGKSVESIGDYAFYNCKKLAKMELPDGLKTIGSYAFYSCESLSSIKFPDGVTTILEYAFYNCSSLVSVGIPESVKSIGEYAFYNCKSLKNIVIPDGVTSIEDNTFAYCKSLISISLPETLTSIENRAFYLCRSLKAITIPDSVTSIGDYAFYECDNMESVELSDNVKSIGSYAFCNCFDVNSLEIPGKVKTIGDYAFYGVKFSSVTIPETVTSIGDYAFFLCSELQSIEVSENNAAYSSIDGVLFSKNQTTLIKFPEGKECSSYVIPDSVTSFGADAFASVKINTVILGSGLTSIKSSAFYTPGGYPNSIDILVIPIGITSIGSRAFDIGDVFYEGTEEQWQAIEIASGNEAERIHYSVNVSEWEEHLGEPVYTCKNTTWVCSCGYKIRASGGMPDAHAFPEEWFVEWEATCFEEGYRYKECTYCNTRIEETIPMAHWLNYDSVSYEEKPTCTEDGFRLVYCDYCGEQVEEIIPATGHTYSTEWTIDKEPTCTEDGSKSHHCLNCDDKADVTIISALGGEHKYSDEWTTDKEPTCTEEGSKSYHCIVCGDKTDITVIAATGHNYSTEWTIDKAPGCFEEGSKSHHCLKCDAKTDITAIAKEHVPFEHVRIEPTCTEDGESYMHCEYCMEFLYSEKIPTTGHNYGDWIVEIEPTCSSEGSKYKFCANYDYNSGDNCHERIDETIPALGHNDSTPYYVAYSLPTCTEDGVDGKQCQYCYELFDYRTIPATGHTVSQWNIEAEASCSQEGFKWGYCDSCGEYIQETTPKTHIINDWNIETEATCTNEGCKYGYCGLCGGYVEEIIPATGHSYSTKWTIDVKATCTEDGSKSHHCLNCESKTDVTVISATGHDYKFDNTLSVHPHTKTYKCSFCEDEKNEKSTVSNCVECNFTITAADSSSYKLVSYIGSGIDVRIPALYNNRAITMISSGCFKGKTAIKSVTIEEGITSIGSLAFMNCTALEKVIIPASVTSIGANAFFGFKGTIYCMNGSFAHEYAVANNIDYVLMSIVGKGDTYIDFNNFLIRTGVQNCKDILELLGVSETTMALAIPSYTYGSLELLGTGSTVSVFDGDDYIGDFTLVVEGDTNGDSICDVIDCAQVARASNGFETLEGAYAMAADSNADDTVDANDYQSIINKALAS